MDRHTAIAIPHPSIPHDGTKRRTSHPRHQKDPPQPAEHHDLAITVDLENKIIVVANQNSQEHLTELVGTNVKAIATALLAIVGLEETHKALLAKLVPTSQSSWRTTGQAIQVAVADGTDLLTYPVAVLSEETPF